MAYQPVTHVVFLKGMDLRKFTESATIEDFVLAELDVCPWFASSGELAGKRDKSRAESLLHRGGERADCGLGFAGTIITTALTLLLRRVRAICCGDLRGRSCPLLCPRNLRERMLWG